MAEEQRSLTNSFKSNRPKGYGAAVPSSSLERQCKTVTLSHKVTKSDSLTSLAIRYGSTVADIKRVNKLWNNEALSFRDTITIPVYNDQSSKSSPNSELALHTSDRHMTSSGAAANGADISANEFFENFDKCISLTPDMSKSDTSSSSLSHVNGPSKSLQTSPSPAASDVSAGNSDDFFARFDQSLSVLKKKVEHQASSAEYNDKEDVLFDSKALLRPKPSPQHRDKKGESSQRSSRSSIRSSTDDIRTAPEPVIKAKVKKKLKKHEQRQDELFKL